MNKKFYLSALEQKVLSAGYDKCYAALCMDYANRLLENHLPVIFDITHLAGLLGTEKSNIDKIIFSSEYYYRQRCIPKKSGGMRTLHIPSLELKAIQRWIVDNILKNIPISDFATAFSIGSSIVKNAEMHVGQECVLNLDIKDFFPSINFEQVFRVFSYYGYTKEVSFYLSRLCVYQDELPQGSPASPWLSNIICLKLDKRLSLLATTYQARYTRYADDITFSGSRYIGRLIGITRTILEEEGFRVNEKKVRMSCPGSQQEVTGLIVNNSTVHVNRRYKRIVKQEIYYCLKYGVADHLHHIQCDKTFYKEHLYGKVFFINMVEPAEGVRLLAELDKIDWDY